MSVTALNKLVIRTAKLDDIPAIHAIHKAWQRDALADLSGGFLSVYYRPSELKEICRAGDLIAIEANGIIKGCAFINNAIFKPHKQIIMGWLADHEIAADKVGLGYSFTLTEGLKGKGHAEEIARQAYRLLGQRYCFLCSTLSKLNEPSRKVHARLGYSFYDVHPEYWIILKDLAGKQC